MTRMADLRARLRALAALIWMRLSAAISLLLVVLLSVAVLSYAPQDSSLNVSGGAAVGNWLGTPGAIAADMVLQLFGLAVWLILLPLGARAARQLAGTTLSMPNWRFIAAIVAPLLMALALALGGRQTDPLAPIPGGALGELLADGLEMALAAFSIFMPRQVELPLAYTLGGLAMLAALFGSGMLRNTARLGWRSVQSARHVPQLARRIGAFMAVLHPARLQEKLTGRVMGWRSTAAETEMTELEATGETAGETANSVRVADKNRPRAPVAVPRAKPSHAWLLINRLMNCRLCGC